MSTRVVFLPGGRKQVPAFVDLGQGPDGRWGLLDDQAWLAADQPGEIELLYLSHPDFLQAMRGLEPDQVAAAVLHRRAVFSAKLPARALGEVALTVSRLIGMLAPGARATAIVADLLAVQASFTTVERYATRQHLALLDYVREGDAEIIAELESRSLREAGDFDRDGLERHTRRQLALELGQIMARHGQAGEDRVLPFFDVTRTYLVTPAEPKARAQARFLGEPVYDWRDGMVLPLPERLAVDVKVRGCRLQVVFPGVGPFLSALQECTQAQLEVELGVRLTAPGYAAYLDQRRLAQAVRRFAAHLVVGPDPEIGPVLLAQTQTEVSHLLGWLARDSGTTLAMAEVPAELDAVIGTANLLALLCRQRDGSTVAGKIEALARALAHVAEEARG